MLRAAPRLALVALVTCLSLPAFADDGGADAAAPLGALGAACATATQCASSQCVDGVCCNGACTGQCEACDETGAAGTCVLVVGEPRGARAACAAGTASNPCAAATCDGITAASCDAFAGASVTCGAPACTNGVVTLAGTCNGTGNCATPAAVPCGAYMCGPTYCKASCASSADCAAGGQCDVASGKCITGATCDGAHTVTDATGHMTDCSPYDCQPNGTCYTECGTDNDCIPGFVCNTSHSCVSAASTCASCVGDQGMGGSSGGCTATAPAPLTAAGLFAIAATFLALAGRRRRPRV